MTSLTLKGVRLYDRFNEKVEDVRHKFQEHQKRLMDRVNGLQERGQRLQSRVVSKMENLVNRLERFNIFGGV